MDNASTLNNILGFVPDPPQSLVDNWQTAFIWLAMGIITFALIALFFGIKRVSQGKHVNKGMLPFVKWPLLFASAGFNVFFTYYTFLPGGQTVAAFSAVVMGGVNLAEAFLIRLIIATWRHDMKVIFRLALLFTIPVFLYSLMAAGSSFSTMMNKNKDVQAASQLELQAAQDRIRHADSQVKEAQIGANNGNLLSAMYRTEVRNSRGVAVPFSQVKASCDSGGYYALNYPELCNQYQNVRNGVTTAVSVASASTQALAISANEKMQMAKIIKERPPEITPTLLGFGLGIAMVGFIVSLALESAIIGVGFFEELFIKPTPLPGLVKFANKALDWNASSITQRGLQVDVSPSPGTVNFSDGDKSNPFSSVDKSNETVQGTPQPKKRTSPAESVQGTVQELSEDDFEIVYAGIKNLIINGKMNPTVRPVTNAVLIVMRENSERISIDVKKTEKPQRQEVAVSVLARLEDEGIIEKNSEGGVGKPKYLLSKKYREAIIKKLKESRKVV